MENREFRDDLKEMWLSKHVNSTNIGAPYMQRVKDMQRPTGEKFVDLVIDPKPEVKIVTTSDMIRLTAIYTAGCLILMGAAIAVVAVLA
ncbi:hypothetical protein [Pseudomonas phage HU1]|nr:hypothetical protein [Pseudomonas phage HU1]